MQGDRALLVEDAHGGGLELCDREEIAVGEPPGERDHGTVQRDLEDLPDERAGDVGDAVGGYHRQFPNFFCPAKNRTLLRIPFVP